MKTWIDYKQIKSVVDFAQVLAHYGVEHKVKGMQAIGFCPLPGHQGQKKSPSFSVNLERSIFQCFGCGAKGNAIEFTAIMEGLDPANPGQFRKAALMLQERYAGTTKGTPPQERPEAKNEEPKRQRPSLINVPLDFTLKGLDPDHPYLQKRGYTRQTIEHFGLGYCNRGLMKGRIAIPLSDDAGNLVGYAGRIVNDEAIDADNPKYLLPGSRERDGTVHEFAKSLFLYHAHTITSKVSDLIVVEGFPATWRLWQHGRKNVVALMGAQCNTEQAALIVTKTWESGHVWIVPDGDEAGRRCAQSVLMAVASHRFCRWIRLPNGGDPDLLTQAEADKLLPGSC